MPAHSLELEGTWEEVAAHAPELKGRRVRLVVLDSDVAEPLIEDRLRRLESASGRLAGPTIPLEALQREILYEERA